MSILDSIFAVPNYWAWHIGGSLLMALELLAPGVFLLWIGIGGVLTGLVIWAIPDLSLQLQLLVFIVATLAFLVLSIFLHKRLRKHETDQVNRGMSAYIGRSVVASDDFVCGIGRIRVDDTYYTAHASQPIQQGQHCQVVALSQGVLQVEPLIAKESPHAQA